MALAAPSGPIEALCAERRRVVLLGSTGSIGTNCLDVIAALPDRLQAIGLSAHANGATLLQQIERHRPRWAVLTDPEAATHVDRAALAGVELLVGQAGIERMVTDPAVDVVVVAIVGSAGLFGTWAALQAGKTVAF